MPASPRIVANCWNAWCIRTPRARPRWSRARRDADAPLSFSQEQLWFLDQLGPGNPSYNIAASVRFAGALDAVALQQALGAIVSRHESLRTTFVGATVNPSRSSPRLWRWICLSWTCATCRKRSGRGRRKSWLSRRCASPSTWLTARFCAVLMRVDEEAHLLFLTLHHIIADGWSMRVLVREVAEIYEDFAAGQESLAPDLPVQYADFAVWQRQWLQGERLERQLAYWTEKLADGASALDLPTDFPRPAVQTFRGGRHPFHLEPALAGAVRALARKEGCTPFMVLLAAFQTLLYRLSGQEDVSIGTPIAGRNRAETEGLIGFFVNTLVLRGDLSGDPTFAELLGRVRQTCLDAYAHQDLPFEMLVKELRPVRDLGRTPLFQVLFSFDLEPDAQVELPGLSLAFAEIDAGTAKFDLSLYVRESAGGLGGFLEYSADLFRPETAARMVGHWQTLLTAAAGDPGLHLAELPLLTESERQRILLDWNNTPVPLPPEQCLHQLVESQVERTPNAVALIAGEEQLTYRQLNSRANQLAHHLHGQGVGPEDLVGVCMERSAEMVIALLAILKAGGAYLPLDPSHPAERLGFIMDDARVRVIVTQQRLVERLPPSSALTVRVDADRAAIVAAKDDNPESGVDGRNLAYVLFTSGSTGRPKGVGIEHRSTVSFVDWVRSTFSKEELAGVLAATSIGFDISVVELFGPLSCGGCMILAENALALPGLPAASAVTLINTVPSAMAELLQMDGVPPSVQTVVLAGEALPHPLARRVYQKETVRRLFNMYGPTETTVFSTGTLVPPGAPEPPTIGKPIANTRVYVLDAHRQPVPVGVPGELFIGGVGVARGYLHRDELTAEKFVPDPFGNPSDRLYRTGDLVRWLPAGELDYLGRLDHQVKIRGFRIEPGEIEAVLLQHPAVRQAVVAAREDSPGEKRLVAYAAVDGSLGTSSRELQRCLKEQLPEHMVPSAIVVLEALPLTPNGKIDRKALPAPQTVAPPENEAEPRTPVEEIVAGVWAEVLRTPRVGARANFFELGGHSLLATRVVSRIRDLFNLDLPVRALFEAPTVAELAAWIEAARIGEQARAGEPIRPAPPEETLSLSFAQKRMWFLDQWQTGSALYNIPAAVRLSGPLDAAALQESLQEIVRRHQGLRTTFPAEHGQPSQKIAANGELRLPVVDLSDLPEHERETEVQRRAHQEARAPFDLAHGPLLRVALLRLGASEHVVLVVMHHIVSDGWSLGVFLEEMAALYGANEPSPLAELPVQYADYAAWQRQWLQGPVLERQLSYWRERLDGAPASLDLPTDHVRPAVPSYRGAALRFDFPPSLTEAVVALGRRYGCTPFMVLLAAFQTVLHRYSGQDDLSIGTPIAGRNRAETEGLIGFFVNTLVLRGDLAGDPTFAELLARVRETCLGAYAHQDVPFERLVEELRPQRDLSRTPFFQVLFALDHEPDRRVRLPGLTFRTSRIDTGTAKFDISLHMTETADQFNGYLEYSSDLFEEETAVRLVGHFRTLLDGCRRQRSATSVGTAFADRRGTEPTQAVERNGRQLPARAPAAPSDRGASPPHSPCLRRLLRGTLGLLLRAGPTGQCAGPAVASVGRRP